MIERVETNRDLIVKLGLEPKLFNLMEATGITETQGYFGHLIEDAAREHGEHEANFSAGLLRSICNAFQYFQGDSLSDWGRKLLTRLSSERYEGEQSDFSELEAFGHLSGAFNDSSVSQIEEKGGKNGKTPDFKAGDDLFIEVYCPDESHKEREKVKNELDKQSGMVKSVLSRPVTGSESLAVKYATNQTIARILNDKRGKDQFQLDSRNVLWVDIKHKLRLAVKHTLPLESINYANQTFVGSFGVWHSFYGKVDSSIFPTGRYSVKFSGGLESDSYIQHRYTGLFRERPNLSAAVVSCLDGNVIFLNPWCNNPLSDDQVHRLTHMSQFRPEYSFFVKQTLESDIASTEASIAFLLEKKLEVAE
jgi:hypothetical protein